jgi:hypothetical protein
MSKKTLDGQLDLFELFDSVEELERTVRKLPEAEETIAEPPEAEEEQTTEVIDESYEAEPPSDMKVEMDSARNITSKNGELQRCFVRDGEVAVVAYLNYRKVYLKEWQKEPVIYQFEDNSAAIDFYVAAMHRLRAGGDVKEKAEMLQLEDAPLLKWKGGTP